VLKLITVFVVLAPHGNEQADMLHRVAEDRLLLEVPKYQNLLKYFTTSELILYPKFHETYKDELKKSLRSLKKVVKLCGKIYIVVLLSIILE